MRRTWNFREEACQKASGAAFGCRDFEPPVPAEIEKRLGLSHEFRREDHGSLTVAVAQAIRPSLRPVNPNPSLVVALMAIRSPVIRRSAARFLRMAGTCGAILGASQTMVRSTLAMKPPRPSTRLSACLRNSEDSALRQRMSEGGKCVP